MRSHNCKLFLPEEEPFSPTNWMLFGAATGFAIGALISEGKNKTNQPRQKTCATCGATSGVAAKACHQCRKMFPPWPERPRKQKTPSLASTINSGRQLTKRPARHHRAGIPTTTGLESPPLPGWTTQPESQKRRRWTFHLRLFGRARGHPQPPKSTTKKCGMGKKVWRDTASTREMSRTDTRPTRAPAPEPSTYRSGQR